MSPEQELQAAIQRSGLVSRRDAILIGVSGGPDSVALLHCLNDLKGQFELCLEVAHLQHGTRGEDAVQDARFVAALAAELNLPFHLHEVDLPLQRIQARRGNLEGLGRAERYKFFASVARDRRLGKVAIAHTQDDQAETLLMWLLRGCGMKGLGGMPARRAISQDETGSPNEILVIRPFLQVSKLKIRQYLEDRGIAWRDDATNSDPALLRNWLRLRLIPCMETKVGVGLAARLSRQAAVFRDEDDYLEGLARKELQAIGGPAGLDRERFLRLPTAMQRRLLRLWIEQTHGHLRAVDYQHIEQAIRLIDGGPPQSRLSLPAGWELAAEYGIVKLERRWSRRSDIRYDYRLEVGRRLAIPESDMEITSEYIPNTAGAIPETLLEAAFDAAALQGALTVRNFRRGDRLQPLGMVGHKKVKDLFIEKKIPLSLRRRLPLLIAGGDILWIPGYARSELGKISAATTAIVRLRSGPIPR